MRCSLKIGVKSGKRFLIKKRDFSFLEEKLCYNISIKIGEKVRAKRIAEKKKGVKIKKFGCFAA